MVVSGRVALGTTQLVADRMASRRGSSFRRDLRPCCEQVAARNDASEQGGPTVTAIIMGFVISIVGFGLFTTFLVRDEEGSHPGARP
jgi:hypothetical protein